MKESFFPLGTKVVYSVLNVVSDIPQATLTLTSNMDGGELIRKGDTVYLQCEVKANPSVHTIQWTFEVHTTSIYFLDMYSKMGLTCTTRRVYTHTYILLGQII